MRRKIKAYESYWTKTVNGTKNPYTNKKDVLKESRENWEVYHETSASHEFKLVNRDFSMVDVPVGGYTRRVIDAYLLSI